MIKDITDYYSVKPNDTEELNETTSGVSDAEDVIQMEEKIKGFASFARL